MLVWEWFSQVFLYRRIGLVEFPPFTFPHFDNSNFSSRVTTYAFDPFPSFCLKVFFSYSRSCLLTRTVMIEPIHCFKHCSNVHTTQLQWNSQPFTEFLLCKGSQFCSPVSFVVSTTWPNFRNFEFLWRGLNLCKSAWNSYLVYSPVGIGWHIE